MSYSAAVCNWLIRSILVRVCRGLLWYSESKMDQNFQTFNRHFEATKNATRVSPAWSHLRHGIQKSFWISTNFMGGLTLWRIILLKLTIFGLDVKFALQSWCCFWVFIASPNLDFISMSALSMLFCPSWAGLLREKCGGGEDVFIPSQINSFSRNTSSKQVQSYKPSRTAPIMCTENVTLRYVKHLLYRFFAVLIFWICLINIC